MHVSAVVGLALVGAAVVAAASAGAAPPVKVTADPSKAGAAISPYLYGQFIEHLGRCIRQGIWAEMLRDRKFLQEPGKWWELVKPAGADFDAFLDPAAAYAGDHGMALWLRAPVRGSCGIRQAGLGVVAGKEYVGYALLCAVGKPTTLEIRLQWGAGADDGQAVRLEPTGAYRKVAFRFTAAATTDNASLTASLCGPGQVWIGCLSLMPADNVRGMRPDTLALIRKVDSPITRWPGGNFVSGYDWKDGIGDRDRRPPRWERAWNDVEDNDFGIDEFMAYCRAVKTEPYICVNAGLGSATDAADQVEYANGAASTRWGRLRAANGHARPYGVVWWGVGNEMYGDWQLGNVPAERYALRHSAFVSAMRGRDRNIKIIGVGSPGRWNDTLLGYAAGDMEMLSGHHYSGRGVRMPMKPDDARRFGQGFAAYSASVAEGVRGIVADFRKRAGGAQDIGRLRLAVDEWGIVRDWDPKPDDYGIGSFEHYYCLGDAIAAARGLHEILRNADVIGMANWAQLVNVIAAIKTSRTGVAMDPVGHMLALYRAQVLGRIVPIEMPTGEPVDAVAAWDEGKRVLSVALVNHSGTADVAVSLSVSGAAGSVRGWRIAGRSLDVTNVPGRSEEVSAQQLAAQRADQPAVLPRHSITVLKLTIPSR